MISSEGESRTSKSAREFLGRKDHVRVVQSPLVLYVLGNIGPLLIGYHVRRCKEIKSEAGT